MGGYQGSPRGSRRAARWPLPSFVSHRMWTTARPGWNNKERARLSARCSEHGRRLQNS